MKNGMKKKGLYLGANVFSTKVLIGDAIFTSPTGDGTASFRVHPSHAKVQSFAGQRSTFITQSFLRRWVFGSRDLPLCSQALYWLIWANPAVVWYEELHCPRPQQCMKWCLYILAYIPHNAVVTPCVCLFVCFCLFLLCFWGTTSAILSSHNVCNLRSHLLACQQALNLECASKASHPVLHCINSWAAVQCIPLPSISLWLTLIILISANILQTLWTQAIYGWMIINFFIISILKSLVILACSAGVFWVDETLFVFVILL